MKGCMANEYGSQYNHTNDAGGIFDCQRHWGIGYKKFVYCGNCFYGVQLHHGNYLGILQSPDLAITEAAVGAGVDSVLFFLTLKKVHALKGTREG